jgi:hypothetical protein
MKLERMFEIETNDIHAGDQICAYFSQEGDFRMKVKRTIELETNDIHVGDRIRVGKHTATCTDTTTPLFWFKSSSSKAALFLLDQYITGHGHLREVLQSEEVLNDFADIRDQMVPFEDGDILKIPYGSGWDTSEISMFRPIFLISMEKDK